MFVNFVNYFLQSQALALTYKASPPSRPDSVPSLPRSPQSQQSHQSHQSQAQSTPQPSTVQPHQQQTPVSSTQPTFSTHTQHPKQEVAPSPKQDGFDINKSASGTGKSIFKSTILIPIIMCHFI